MRPKSRAGVWVKSRACKSKRARECVEGVRRVELWREVGEQPEKCWVWNAH